MFYFGYSTKKQQREIEIEKLEEVEKQIETSDFELLEPTKFMSAKTYKTQIVQPIFDKLKAIVKRVMAHSFKGWDNYHRLNNMNGKLYRENERLSKTNEILKEENKNLREQNKEYSLLQKVFGYK